MTNLTTTEIAALPFGKRCRFGIADRTTRQLTHSSDSKAWILGEIQRLENVKYQFVIKP